MYINSIKIVSLTGGKFAKPSLSHGHKVYFEGGTHTYVYGCTKVQ